MPVLPEFNLFGEAVPPPPPPKPSYATVYLAYERGGMKLDKWGRNVLGQQAKRLVSEGRPIEQVAQAAGELSRAGSSPAKLERYIREMPERCVNGEARARLTQGQLQGCPCAKCRTWAELRAGRPLEL